MFQPYLNLPDTKSCGHQHNFPTRRQINREDIQYYQHFQTYELNASPNAGIPLTLGYLPPTTLNLFILPILKIKIQSKAPA